jgi:hypothetical protein
MPARPKQQHYVTRGYLEGFLESGQEHLFCYGRKRLASFQSRPSELARQRNYYSVRQPDGGWNDSLELEIEQRVETPGLEVIQMLSLAKTRLDWSQRNALSMFMAVQRFRVPHLRQMLDATHAHVVQQLLEEYDRRQQEHGGGRLWIRSISPFARADEDIGPPAYVSRQELEEARRTLQEDPGQFSRESLFSMAHSFATMFRRFKWSVYYLIGDSRFITSDCPVLIWHERDDVERAGIIRPDTHIEFPLSRTSMLSMTHDFPLINRLSRLKPGREARRLLENVPEIRVFRAGEPLARQFNLRQAQYCARWAFAGRQSDWLVEELTARSRNVRQRIVRDGDFIRLDALTGENGNLQP